MTFKEFSTECARKLLFSFSYISEDENARKAEGDEHDENENDV